MTDISSSSKKERYWEIDTARGICLICMVLFHAIFILGVFNIIPTDIWENIVCQNIVDGINFEYIHLGTSFFVLICGLSLTLRLRRMEGSSRKAYNIAVIKRGLEIIIIGVIIALIGSILIHFFIGDGRFMYFTILMMMGCSMIITLPFIGLKKWACIPALIIIILGLFLSTIQGPAFLLPFGILPGDFMPRDYFPLFPWAGIMLLGYALGWVLYPNGYRRFTLPSANKICTFLAKVGNYPLQIYVLHIPVLVGIIALVCLITAIFSCPISPVIP